MNAPFIRNIIIGSVASVLQMQYKDIVEKLNNPEDTLEFEEFGKRLVNAEELLSKQCEEYSKSKPDFMENGSWYVFKYVDIVRGAYFCIYTLKTPAPS